MSIGDIARKANVSQVTIYNHFTSKENLVQDWISAIQAELINRLQAIAREEKPYQEKLQDTFQCLLKVLSEKHLETGDLEIQDNPEIRPLLIAIWSEIENQFLALVHEGKSQGNINPELSDEAVKLYFDLILQGVSSSPELHVRIHNSEKVSRDLVSLMVYGFTK